MCNKPTLWQRIANWRRWPWRPLPSPDTDQWGRQPWLATVRENGVIIGWHPIDQPVSTTTIKPGRWSCLAGLVSGRLIFEVRICRDEQYDRDIAAVMAAAAAGRLVEPEDGR